MSGIPVHSPRSTGDPGVEHDLPTDGDLLRDGDLLVAAPVQGRGRPVTAPGGGILSRAHRSVTLGALALVSLTAFEALAVTTAMPVIVQALDGLALYALAFGAPLATGIVGMVLGGSWADARGPAAPLRAGTAVFTLGLLLFCANASAQYVNRTRITDTSGNTLTATGGALNTTP